MGKPGLRRRAPGAGVGGAGFGAGLAPAHRTAIRCHAGTAARCDGHRALDALSDAVDELTESLLAHLSYEEEALHDALAVHGFG